MFEGWKAGGVIHAEGPGSQGEMAALIGHTTSGVAHCLLVAGHHTTISLVPMRSPIKRDFVLLRGADVLLRPEHLDRAYLSAARVLNVGGVMLSAGGREAAMHAVRWAQEEGLLVAFDANYQPALWPGRSAARDAITAALRHADIAKLDEKELKLLVGTDDTPSGSRRLLDLGVRLCLITFGAEGAWFDDGQVRGHVAGFPVEVVDATGCGDAFVAAFLAGLLAEACGLEDLDEAALRRMVAAANAAGALNGTRPGGIAGLPTRAGIDALLARGRQG